MTAILDELRWLVWSRTKAAEKGKNMPKPLLPQLLADKQEKKKLTRFDSPEAFEEQKKRIIAGDGNG